MKRAYIPNVTRVSRSAKQRAPSKTTKTKSQVTQDDQVTGNHAAPRYSLGRSQYSRSTVADAVDRSGTHPLGRVGARWRRVD
eukprot:2142563-Pyramimonas_sp.AAC.1